MGFDAGNAYEIVERGVEYIGKRAEPFDQRMCDLVGVLLRDRIKKKQLQYIMRFKMIESFREKSMLHAFSVVFVHSSSALGVGQPRDASAQPSAVLPLSVYRRCRRCYDAHQ